MITFDDWIQHFETNDERHQQTEPRIPWGSASALSENDRQAFAHSFQRFELGESGDGSHLLSMAAEAGDPVYTAALGLLVREEQKHSALFGRGLEHLNATALRSHWSDAVFTALRRLLGLRTEIGLFLIAESIAMGYFEALAERAPDPVLRAIGSRIRDDERNHIRFQVDRPRQGFSGSPAAIRVLVALAWGAIAVGAATVIVVDHRAALRACGVRPVTYWAQSLGRFAGAARSALFGGRSSSSDVRADGPVEVIASA